MNLIKAVKKCRDGKRGFQLKGYPTDFIFVPDLMSGGSILFRNQDGSFIEAPNQSGSPALWNPTVSDFERSDWVIVTFKNQLPKRKLVKDDKQLNNPHDHQFSN